MKSRKLKHVLTPTVINGKKPEQPLPCSSTARSLAGKHEGVPAPALVAVLWELGLLGPAVPRGM